MHSVRETALDWFARLHADDVGADEQARFRQWRDADPTHAAAYDKVAAFWDSEAFTQAGAEMTVVEGAVPLRRLRPPVVKALAAVAASVLLWVAAVGLDLPTLLRADYRAPVGGRQEVALADGSRIVLNSGAAIAVTMTEDRRAVRLLVGEAYFDVARDPARPFTVDGGAVQVSVLGTRFSVRADAGTEAVAVRSGLVQVIGRNGGAARLEADQAIQLAGGALGPVENEGENSLAWLDGILVFHDRPLAEVLAELDRYHPGMIVLANRELGQIRVSGHYRLDDPVAVLDSLARVVSARVARLTDAVLVVR